MVENISSIGVAGFEPMVGAQSRTFYVGVEGLEPSASSM